MSYFIKPESQDPLLQPFTGPDFDLIETILWENGSYFLRDLHLARLERSAKHFLFVYNIQEINGFLDHAVLSFDKNEKYRIRLVVKKNGKLQLSSQELDIPEKLPVKVVISPSRTDAMDEFLYHKTTNRKLYEHELTKCRSNGFFDSIFLNQTNEVTEGAISNIIIRKGDEYFTPPLSCGLLPGVYRDYLLNIREDIILKEKLLFIEDLKSADEIFMINSVRKMVPAIL
ncbi:MAG: aminotransferase class IV [Candidatus Omnitrophota bacterium]|nr:aminotransferase class IV [Candidatus Omnitrophota bacterium]